MKRKRVVVLGATGSIGESALKVARDIPERMEIVGLAANSNAEKLAAAANETRAQSVCLVDETKIDALQRALKYKPRIFSGEAGLREIACLTDADMVLVAIVGTGGLRPALAAIEAGKDLAVASKEILVMAGEIVMREARENGVHVCPWIASTMRFFNVWKAKTTSGQFAASSSLRPVDRFAKRRERDFDVDHTGTGAKASDLEHGPEDHNRFGHAVQQRAGDDRGALALRRRDEASRSGDSSAEHRAFDGRVRGRLRRSRN